MEIVTSKIIMYVVARTDDRTIIVREGGLSQACVRSPYCQ